jgi:hypothetical protein
MDREKSFRSALHYESEDELCEALQSQLDIGSSDWILRPVGDEPCSLSVKEEARRLNILKSYQILNAENEEALDRVTESVRASFDVPWACISLVDMGRQRWQTFERQDIEYPKDVSRHDAICSRTILQNSDSVLVVKDLLLDDRFKDSQLVRGKGPCFRFYAGAPLVSPEGARLGALCLLDKDPRPQGLDAEEQKVLLRQARDIMQLLVDRRSKMMQQQQSIPNSRTVSLVTEDDEASPPRNLAPLKLIPRAYSEAELPDPVTSTLDPEEYLFALTRAMYGVELQVRPAMELQDFFRSITEEQMAAYNMDIVSACRRNDVGALREFLQTRGRESLNCFNRFGEGLLNMACRRGFKEIVQFLLSDEVCLGVHVRDDYGRTPMHDTCWNPEPQLEICAWIMAEDPCLFLIADSRGYTPFQYARKSDWLVWRKFLFSNRDLLANLAAQPSVLNQFLRNDKA